VNRRLVARAVDWLAPASGAAVLDAFCGLGNFSLALGRTGAAVEGLEVSRRMVDGARANARNNGVAGATFTVRDLHDATSVRLPADRFAAALLDPPRTGAAALVAEIARRRIPTVLYVSCLPSALGRDARLLAEAGYRLERLTLVDMFPQTSHIESMALFVHAGGRRGKR
jgi:23S rRNA (uracil1939-C5)-methyltransferase